MKTVLFLRHGKSDWSADYDQDHGRPLAGRGKKASSRIGKLMRTARVVPDIVVCSSAVRAVSTLERVMRKSEWSAPVHVTDELYGAGPDDVLALLRSLPDDAATALLVGHEPTTSETIELLVGGGEVTIKTGALACVEADADTWKGVAPGSASLQWLVTPRLLG